MTPYHAMILLSMILSTTYAIHTPPRSPRLTQPPRHDVIHTPIPDFNGWIPVRTDAFCKQHGFFTVTAPGSASPLSGRCVGHVLSLTHLCRKPSNVTPLSLALAIKLDGVFCDDSDTQGRVTCFEGINVVAECHDVGRAVGRGWDTWALEKRLRESADAVERVWKVCHGHVLLGTVGHPVKVVGIHDVC